MTDSSRENVPRGDHVPGGHTEENDEKLADQAESGTSAAAQPVQGAHGKVGDEGSEENPRAG